MQYKYFFLLLMVQFFNSSLITHTFSEELQTARTYYQQGKDNNTAAENLKTFTETKLDKPIFKAYNGVSYAMMAKHHWNPYKKLEFVNKGLELLNQAITANAADVEMRFLRFSVEENLPSVVSFTSHIQADKTYILANIKPTHAFYNTMKGYLKTSKNLSEAEKKKL